MAVNEIAAPNLIPYQRQQLHSLLLDCVNLFSQALQDLGQTDLVKHNINVSDAQPVRQVPRRLPSAKQEETQKAVGDMAEQGLIEMDIGWMIMRCPKRRLPFQLGVASGNSRLCHLACAMPQPHSRG